MYRWAGYITQRSYWSSSVSFFRSSQQSHKSEVKMKIKFCWMRKLARRTRRSQKTENIEVLGFRKIKSRIECKSKSHSYFTFLSHHRNQKRKHQEELIKERTLEDSGVYVDMTLRKIICEKSLTAVLLEARSESIEEFDEEPLYISADYKGTSTTEPESSIYEYFEF